MASGKQRKHLVALVLLGMVVVAAGAWWLMPTGGNIRNVLLISIDTCRADHLSCYGYEQRTTPNIDALARQGILFENAISPVPLTLPAHSSMLTGTIPPYHGVHDNTGYQLDDDILCLAEILKDAGFATAAAISAFVLDSKHGLGQGFDVYDDTFKNPLDNNHVVQRRGDETTEHALEWIDANRDTPFFYFLHYYDPHHNYAPPEPFASRFPSHPYAGEIAYTDHCIGQVVRKLKELDLYQSTLLIIVGDHGEMLGEHGENDHAFFVYQSAIRIPLIFKLPGAETPARLSSLVGLVDIVPTVCSLLDVAPPPDIQGRDLTAYWMRKDTAQAERYMYCESFYPTFYGANSLVAVISDRTKFIRTTRPELYDLIDDPAESNNLFKADHHLARQMDDALEDILDASLGGTVHDSQVTLDDSDVERIQSLGYVGHAITETFEFDPDKEDPKDYLGFHLLNHEFTSFMTLEKFNQARSVAAEMIRQKPENVLGHKQMAVVLTALEDYQQAIDYGRKAVEIDPDNPLLHAALANLYDFVGDTDQAIASYRHSIAIDPDNASTQHSLGKIHLARKEFVLAADFFRAAINLKPDFSEALNYLGNACKAQGQTDEAIRYYEQVLALDPSAAGTRYNLGNALVAQGDPEAAILHYRRAIQHVPDHTKSYNNLAWLLATEKEAPFYDPVEAVSLAQKACEITANRDYAFLDLLAIAHAAAGDFHSAIEAAQKALVLAERADDNAPLASLKTKLELFKAYRPYHPGR